MSQSNRKWKTRHKVLVAMLIVFALPCVMLESVYQYYAWDLEKPAPPSTKPLPHNLAHAIRASHRLGQDRQIKPFYSWTIMAGIAAFLWEGIFTKSTKIKVSDGFALSDLAIRHHMHKLCKKQRCDSLLWYRTGFVMTLWTTRHWSESQALNYLASHQWFGGKIFGVRKGAKVLYRKSLEQLSVDEAAYVMLVAY